MHDIEPWHGWRDEYSAESDKKSPFFGRKYDEFTFSNKIYNYFIHPQWDFFGSETLFGKILYVDYKRHFALIELIGEWNDCITNDSMFLKRDLADILIKHNISRFVVLCDNVLNFHGDDDSYYEEWYEDIRDDDGWICLVNTFDHVSSEMKKYRLYNYLHFGPEFNAINWRTKKPAFIIDEIEDILNNSQKNLL
ncbi:MAG: hypothetical protein IPO92_05035 [Saprospiraceae bacterium]|nr:hypothetical protein [Saprospiraceae bacterium]